MIRTTAAGVLGLALVAGCGTSRPASCLASTCGGCCGAQGECLATAAQDPRACGAAGATCRACLPGQLCAQGACVDDPDASVYLDQLDAGAGPADAGTRGADAGLAELGAPCSEGAQCSGGLCIAQSTVYAAVFPGGACSQDCASQLCPADASCSSVVVNSRSLCLPRCDWDGGAGGCRAGYVCDRGLVDGAPAASACTTGCTEATQCPPGHGCEGGFCCGGRGFRCCQGASCPVSGSCGVLEYCQ
jgi:hypothetical protein